MDGAETVDADGASSGDEGGAMPGVETSDEECSGHDPEQGGVKAEDVLLQCGGESEAADEGDGESEGDDGCEGDDERARRASLAAARVVVNAYAVSCVVSVKRANEGVTS